MAQQRTKLEIIRAIAVLVEELKGTELEKEADKIFKGKFSQIKREQLLDLEHRMNEEIKMSFLRKAYTK